MMGSDYQLQVIGIIGGSYSLEQFNNYMDQICERFGAEIIHSGFFVQTSERDYTLGFKCETDMHYAADAVHEEMDRLTVILSEMDD